MSETSSAGKPNGKPVRQRADPLKVRQYLAAWAAHDRRKALERQKAAAKEDAPGEKAAPEKDLPIQ
ncbi:MAG: hypothetical protein AAB654_08950 [Acidobacteriota bacterium]